MSDHFLRFVPVDSEFIPTERAVAAAMGDLKAMLANAEAIVPVQSAEVQFVDAGSNWEGVHCSNCGADAEPWWGDAMSEASENEFSALLVSARCCGKTVSLNDLNYGWPVAFAKFFLEVQDPGATGLSPQQLASIGERLGCEVREIAVHI
jgi:hypothetical protein